MKSFLFVVDPSWGERCDSRGVVIRDTRVPIVSQLTSHLEQQKVICYYAHCVFAVIPRCAVFPNIYLDMLLLRQEGRRGGKKGSCPFALVLHVMYMWPDHVQVNCI